MSASPPTEGMNGPAEVPLLERLRRIPLDQRLTWTDADGLKATHYVPIGKLAQDAAAEIERLADSRHRNDRWNVETTQDGFRICRGYHERAADCEWEHFVPRSSAGAREREDQLHTQVRIERAKFDNAIKHLCAITAMLKPNSIQIPDGRVMEFAPPADKVLDYWRGLTDAIKAARDYVDSLSPEPYEKCSACDGYGIALNPYNGEPDECSHCDGTTVEPGQSGPPADWLVDSSLETWFPLTAEELKRLREENARLRASSGEPEAAHCCGCLLELDMTRDGKSHFCGGIETPCLALTKRDGE